ncbi:LamG domain-containing protein [Bythopirellula polymerisocia]|uniref:FecR protein n=1 Tax=Bythopirellula polymerisocia TaxID=2528003 RepID=A0A5C6CEE0_9BACT|nr:LamG domain-containing protein [Bythopirellula polymerisocia]TWU21801.1 hypothetical protein Pla144_44970 [Bythopirellula polymerisocia]
MDLNTAINDDILQLLVEMSCGDANEEQFAHLDELVRTEPDVRDAVVTGLTHLADLEWESRLPTNVDTLLDNQATTKSETSPGLPISTRGGVSETSELASGSLWNHQWTQQALTCLSLAATFLVGVAVTQWVNNSSRSFWDTDRHVADLDLIQPQQSAVPIATLVSTTSYMWDPQARVAMETGASLHAGNSVALLDGVAEVEFKNGVTTRIKGPAIFSLSASGTPEIKYGKLVVRNIHDERFHLNMPMANAWIPSGSLVGVDAFGEEVVVHVLEGNATVVPTAQEEDRLAIVAGEAIRLRKTARSELSFFSTEADPNAFKFDAGNGVDHLAIPPKYVELIKESDPVAYWRFDSIDSRVIPNQIGPQHNLRVLGGQIQNVEYGDNHVARFTVREKPGCLVSEDTFDELSGRDYTVELWTKPSHFHRGTLVSLVEKSSDQLGSIERHGLLLEVQSANLATDVMEIRPKSLRFLHRSPPSETLTGTSCFSITPYRPRAWQHVAAVKEGSVMRLYVDGTEVASELDETQLPNKLTLLVGQLFSFGSVRPLVGDLDELAIYSRALSAEDLQRRVALVQPGAKDDK